MRLVLDARYLGPKTSGIGNYVRAIATRLPRLAPELELRLWLPPAGDLPEALEGRSTVRRISAIPNGVASLLAPHWWEGWRSGDLFHSPANILGFGIPAPSVVTVHDVMWLDHLSWCQPNPWLRPISFAFFQTAIRHALTQAKRILTVSQASADAILRRYPGAGPRIVVARNAHEACFQPPAEPAKVRAEAARVLGFDEDYVLVVGQNVPSKGHELALEAFARSAPRHLRLVLVQRLLPGAALAAQAKRLGITERVTFASELPFASLLAVLQSARVLLQPSRAEGFGLPALEAMASGCPVIASDIAPLVEVLGTGGLTFASGDADALSSVLQRYFASSSAYAEQRARGLVRAKDFSWERTAELTVATYREVLAES